MRLGIDIRSLMSRARTGVGEYAFALLDAVFVLDKTNEYFLFYNSYANVSANIPKWTQDNVRYVATKWPNKLFNAAEKIFGRPKLDKITNGIDAFFSPNLNFTALSKKTKRILTIHDLSFEIFPEFFSAKQRLWHWAVNPKKQCRLADLILVPSENTKRDLCDFYKINPEKIKVIYPGIESPSPPPIMGRTEEGVLASLPQKYILFLGTIEPRKNITGLIQAFELAASELPGRQLVIAGAPGWNMTPILERARRSPLQDKIKLIGYVDPADKPALYHSAEIFCYPSFYEGFGFPVLEAMAEGAPVLTSNRSSLPEVACDAAYLIDPNNAHAIAEGMIQLATNQPMREKLITAGRAQAAKFSWSEAAREFVRMVNIL